MGRHQLGEALIETINAHLDGRGLRLQSGTIVDASFIAAPSSTKNQRSQRDPEMHQTRKDRETTSGAFRMKRHIGVDAVSGLTHSLSTTAANTADAPRSSTRSSSSSGASPQTKCATAAWPSITTG